MTAQVVVVGAGPAGLAAAIQCARRDLEVTVLERASSPPDKACGEGLMPSGLAQLAALGVRERLDPADCWPLKGVRYVQEDGTRATGRLPAPGGLGIRRTALTRALADAAVAAGVRIVWNCHLKEHHCGKEEVRLSTTTGPMEADLLVAADGLHSPVRKRAGLTTKSGEGRRFGVRRHFRCAPASDFVEVHLAAGREAFITPVGPELVGVAFLWDRTRWTPDKESETVFGSLLAGFPELKRRFAGVQAATPVQGAGPLEQRVSATVAERLVLIGDAAGYRDAITGEGLSLAFASATALAAVLPGALGRGGTASALRPYARAHARLFRHYNLVAGAVLAIARRPGLRRPLIRWLGARPGLLDRLIAWGLR
jgi:2-polyprenyl-6-methoxyphenol hydroxylase-like FAD-dependent oxidoreductase